MSVIDSIEDVGPWRKQLSIRVPGPAVEAETRRVIDDYRRRARLPGFRKGRVPAELVRQRYEREIDREVVDRLVPRYWRQAEAEAELDVLMPPRVEQVDHQPGSGLTFSATVEVRPQIEVGELDGIELPRGDTEPSESEIDQAIDDLRRQAADWRPADRAAAHGDRVRGGLHRLADGDEAGDEQAVVFEVGDGQVWEELSLAAVGARPGSQVEFGRRERPEAEESRFRLRVDAVEERELPELDDALAGRLGEFADLAALRAAVGERLAVAKRQELRQQRERALLEELRRRHPLALPDGLVQQEVEVTLRAYAEEMARRGVDLEQAEVDWQSLAERERPQAEQRVHSRLLLDAVADQRQIEVGEEEFEQVLAQLARVEGRSTGQVRKALDSSGRLGELRARVRREKLLRGMLGEDEEAPAEGAEDND